jgi:hypothetical protein
MTYICVRCGKSIELDEARGSSKHPYCKKCFKRVWGSEGEYFKWLDKSHSK